MDKERLGRMRAILSLCVTVIGTYSAALK